VAAPPNFRIEAFESDSGTTIKLAGELDSATCPELLERFDNATSGPDARDVIVDLTELSFIDSAGMRALVLIERGAQERDISLTVIPPPAEVTDLLQVTGIAEHITLTPQTGDASPVAPFIERVELSLARDPSAPGRARAELRETFRGRISPADEATATLLTSELVTNAVVHPDPGLETPIGLRITFYADRVRVEVTDAGSGFDAANLQPRRGAAGGHGLFVVDGLSSRWGTRPAAAGAGFCVWFELEVAPDEAVAADRVGASRAP
jgi:anti-anti-sigma factor